MKKVKLIYFPVIFVLTLILFVLSFVHVSEAGSKKGVSKAYLDSVYLTATSLADKRGSVAKNQDQTKDVREEITRRITKASIKTAYSTTLFVYDDDGERTDETYQIAYYVYNRDSLSDADKTPTYFVQSETIKFDTISKMRGTYSDDELFAIVGKEVKNVIVHIPGAKTKENGRNSNADVILFSAHMDTTKIVPSSEDASDTVMLAVMLEEIIRTSESYNGENDLVFLFTDSRYQSSLGMYVFMNQFKGFRLDRNDLDDTYDITKRIKFAVNFDAIGTGAASMLIASSSKNVTLISEYAKAMGANFSSSFVSDIIFKDYYSDFDALTDFNALNLVTFGDLKNQSNSSDSIKGLGEDYIRNLAAKKAYMLSSAIKYFGNFDLDNLNSNHDAVYFSVLGLFTISYPEFVSFILGGILAVLLLIALIITVKKKAFSVNAMARGIVAQIISIIATLLSLFVLYFLIVVLLAGLNVISIQGILSYTYYNPGLMIGFILFGLAMQSLFYNVLRKLLNVKATDIARGGAFTFMVLGIALSFIYPALGYMFVIPGIFAAIIMLISSIIKEKIRQKTQQDIERLLIYMLPLAISFALMIPPLSVAASVLPLVYIPLLILPIIVSLGMVAPYFVALKPMMSKLLLKLPKRTIRVKHTVIERVEDTNKKGSYTEVAKTVIQKEKINWRYNHGVAMSIIAVISAIIIMISASTARPFGAQVYGRESYDNRFATESLFNDSLVISWSHLGGALGTTTTQLMIKDKSLYQDLSPVLSSFVWNADKDAYVKNFNWTFAKTPVISAEGNNTFKIVPAVNGTTHGISEITIRDAEDIQYVSVTDRRGFEIMKIENNLKKENITLRFPHNEYDFTEITIKVDFFEGKNRNNIDVFYKQYVWYDNISFWQTTKDFEQIQSYLNQKSASIRYGMYYEYELSLNIAKK